MNIFKKKATNTNSSSPSGARGSSVVSLTVPRNYSEITEEQLRYIAALQHAGQTEAAIRTKCFIRFAGIKPVAHVGDIYYFVRPKMKGFFSLTSEEVAYFSGKMTWITKNYAGIKPLQKIGKYLACDELLRDTTFIQYLDAENFYQAFIFTKNEEFLFQLIATLYQKGNKYDNDLTEKRAKYFEKHITEAEKLIVIMWMMGVKTTFQHKFKDLFVSVATDPDSEPEAPDMLEIINNQVRMLTEGDITKKGKVLESLTWDALVELNEKCKKPERTPNP